MLITSQTPQEQELRNAQNREILRLNTELYIRKSFAQAFTSIEAESWITIAKEEGFLQMATEMTNDLSFELLTA